MGLPYYSSIFWAAAVSEFANRGVPFVLAKLLQMVVQVPC